MKYNYLFSKFGRLPSWQEAQNVKNEQKQQNNFGSLLRSIVKLIQSM